MRYFYDTEFIEAGPDRPIRLLSIGIVAEDGRELYLEVSNPDLTDASEWVKANVLPHLTHLNHVCDDVPYAECPAYGLPSIGSKLYEFCDPSQYGEPEFWGYYSAYDHVALCQIFGSMMDLPKGWPMYTRDLKQLCDMLGNPTLPKQHETEHHALADARWNRQAWQFLLHEAQALIGTRDLDTAVIRGIW